MLTTRSVRWLSIYALLAGFASAQTIVFTPSTTTLNPGGGSLTFTASISYAIPPSVLAFTTTLPAGWTYVSGFNEPPVKPSAGTTGAMSWSYITTPASPATFSFTSTYPASLTGLQSLSTSTITRDTTDSLPVTTPGPTLTLAAPPAAGLWLGGTGNWTDSTQWSQGVVPNNSGTAAYSAQINAGTATLTSAIAIDQLQFSGGTIAGSGNLTLTGISSTWTAGAFAGLNQLIVAPGAQFTASTFANHDFVGTTILNQGQFMWAEGGALRSGNGGAFINAAGGTFVDAASGTTTAFISSTGGSFTFTNAGTYLKTVNSETRISVPFTNQGGIVISAGNLHFDTVFTQTAGNVFIAGGATAQFDLPLNFAAGSLIGTGTVVGNVSNAAFISPGNILGLLSIQGNLTLLSTSQLLFDIGGTGQGTTYDFLSVSGTASLGGTLTLNVVNNAPATLLFTDTLTVLTANSLSGTFSNAADGARLFSANGQGSFLVNYTATSLTLSGFAPIPEPSTWALLLAGVGAVALTAGRRRK